MDTRKMAESVRLSRWAEVLREQKRSGLSIKGFCEEQGVHRHQFFYWQKKLRKAACEELTGRETAQAASPEGWALCAVEASPPVVATNGKAAATDQITVEVNGIRIEAGSGYPPEKLAQLLRELQKSC